MRWWRVLGLRPRLIIIGLVGLAAGLAAGGFVLVGTLQLALLRTVDDGALQTARTVRDLVNADQLPEQIPAVGAPTAVVQVVDGEGRVRAASPGSDRLVSLLRPAELQAARGGERLFLGGDRAGVDGPLRVVAVPAGSASEPRTVVVAAPFAQVESSTRLLRFALLIGFPLLLVVLAAVAWRVIGLTLRPVEALRRGAEEITGTGATALLPVPDARDEIRRLAVTLNDMLARLDSSRRQQRAFVADAAHELRSPLTNMRTQLEVAQRLGGADWHATADDLLIDAERLSRLVDDLLLLARADWAGGAAAARREPVELVGLVTDLLGRYADGRVAPRLAATDPVWVDGDPDGLRRIVANLLDNAVRHAATAVSVTVECRTLGGAGAAPTLKGPTPEEAAITVTDDGAGIPAEDRRRVFDRFTRLDDARSRDAGGAGLGLAIVNELTRLHGGRVTLHDAEPGVRAEVRLPARSAPPPE